MLQLAQKHIRGDTAVKIAASIEHAIRDGYFTPGQPLPPVRTLASVLNVSPATAASAYQALQNRGLVVSDGRRGTRISHRSVMRALTLPPLPAGVRELRDGNPDPALLPSMAAAIREIDPAPRLYGSARNDAELLRIAAKDFAADGVPAGPISVVNGALDGLERVLREHCRPGDRVAVEDPGFGSVIDLISSLGLIAAPFASDHEGPVLSDLERVLRGRVQALIVMPRAQNPTGAALSARRAADIRELLRNFPELLVILDDHFNLVADTPLRMIIEARHNRWAVVRSMSKALNPDLRLALLTGDAQTMSRLEDRLVVGERWVSHILQRIVARLLGDSAVRRQLAKTARVYTERRTALVDALAANGLESCSTSGFNVWLPVREETAVVHAMIQAGWAIGAGERFRVNSPPAVRITASTLLPDEARKLAVDLAQAMRGQSRTSAA